MAKTLAPCQVATVHVLLLTGSIGSGRSIASEIWDVLAELEIPNVAIDLDALTWPWPASSPWNNDLVFGSLEALWRLIERMELRTSHARASFKTEPRLTAI